MAQNTKQQALELTWIGKHDKKPPLEPRILIENPEYSYGKVETGVLPNGKPWKGNMLIHGDNLLALKALEQDYAGCVKCIYIDPPYNTGNAFEHYDDGVEHSIWLSLMRPRLELLKMLLADDGILFVQIDDNEQAYLTVMLDEIFGRHNRINTICIKMSEASGVKMAHIDRRLPKLKEYILMYCKKDMPTLTAEKVPIEEWNEEYKNIVIGLSESEIDELHLLTKQSANDVVIERCNEILSRCRIKSLTKYFKEHNIPTEKQELWKFENAKYIIQTVGSSSVYNIAKNTQMLPQDIMAVRSASGLIYLIKTDVDITSKQPRVQVIFAHENLMRSQGDLWLDIKTTGGVGQEGDVLFTNSKKPEKLIKKIITMCTSPNDIVLDSFLGSGTTAAVAQKMGRKYIGIEMGNHAYTHCAVRLKKVVDGTDQGGISKAQNWKGGGGFRFYELAPSLLKEDKFGNLIINKEYNADMLAAAMAKQEGFTYAPSNDIYWKQGFSSENDYIYTTTQFMTVEGLTAIAAQMKEGESLLICCTAFQKECLNAYPNITIKKIPQMLLGRCQFNKDDYSLNIIELPDMQKENDVEESSTDESVECNDVTHPSPVQPSLF